MKETFGIFILLVTAIVFYCAGWWSFAKIVSRTFDQAIEIAGENQGKGKYNLGWLDCLYFFHDKLR